MFPDEFAQNLLCYFTRPRVVLVGHHAWSTEGLMKADSDPGLAN